MLNFTTCAPYVVFLLVHLKEGIDMTTNDFNTMWLQNPLVITLQHVVTGATEDSELLASCIAVSF